MDFGLKEYDREFDLLNGLQFENYSPNRLKESHS